MLSKWKFIGFIVLLAFMPYALYAAPCDIAKFSDKQLAYCLYPGPKPVIVLEAGLGNDMSSWPTDFIKKLNRFATVLIYNRVGHESSYYFANGSPKEIILANDTAKNLHDLLARLKITRPVILVGHS